MNTPTRIILSGLVLTAAVLSTRAGTFNNDFNSGQPPGTAVYGNTVVEATGGVGDSGVLKLTKAINSQTAGFVIDDLDGGATVYGFEADFDILLGPGNPPADGMSFCLGNLPDGTWGENGPGNGLAFIFQLYPYSDEVNNPNVSVSMNGGKFITRKYTVSGANGILTYPDYAHVHIRVNADGSFNMDFKGQTIFTNFFIPNYTPAAGRFGFGGRTGGANANQWVDNLQITTLLQPRVGISQQPFSQKVLAGSAAVFLARLTNPDSVALQWYKGATAIPGANTDTLTLPAVTAADEGTYRLVATGPNNTATSVDAVLTVVNLTTPAVPQISMNFDDGIQPANTLIAGSAVFYGSGGVNGTGFLQLTPAVNGQSGAFIILDPNAGAPVYGFTARFDTTAGGGTAPPADGFAFAFGTDIPDAPTGEFEAGGGLGTGLRVTFDIFNNDGVYGLAAPAEGQQPAPSIDVRLGNQVLGSVKLPLSFMETAPYEYGDTIVQLNTDATINVVYRGVLVFDKLPVPGFVSYSGGRFALAARTGGLNADISVDNFKLTTETTPGTLRIASQPTPQTVPVGRPASFAVTVNDPVGTTYQWMRDGVAIVGATDASYTIAATVLADSGAQFKVQATKGATALTSDEASLTVVNLTPPTSPTLTFDFNAGTVSSEASLYGSAYIFDGVLHLTDALNDQNGGLVVTNPVFGGAEVSAISVAFDVRLGGGTASPADGFSFNWGANIPNNTIGDSEKGIGSGVRIGFDLWNNAGEAPSFNIYYKDVLLVTIMSTIPEMETGEAFRRVLLRVDPDGKLYLAYGDRVLANGLQLPNYTFIAASKFGLFARTGGANENHWFDNVLIQATKSSAPLGIAVEPIDSGVLEGRTATFSVLLTDPNGATYQWSKNGLTIAGATQSAYTTPATVFADNGAKFSVYATGPGGAVTSRDAVLTVIPPITIANPQIIYDFNDGMLPYLPNQTILNGAAGGGYITYDGGVTNSGVLRLTDAVNSQGGTFIIPDFNANEPVKAFTVYFAVRVGGGTATPADGFSFVWANDLTDTVVFSENGSGSGLTVGFDIYNNNGEAPSFNIFYKGAIIATKMVDISALVTGDEFVNVFIRLNEDGTVDVQYKGEVVFHKVALPGFAPMTASRFAWGARTGGLNANQWVDNIMIAATVGQVAVPVGWTRVGTDLQLTWGAGWKLQSTPSLSPSNWQDVPGAVSPYTVPMTGAGQFYRLATTP